MSDEVRELLVLADGAGDYYVLPREVIESHRVAPEYRADLADLLQPEATGFDGRITQTPISFTLAGSLRLEGYFGARAGRVLGLRAAPAAGVRATPAKRAAPADR